MTKEELLNRLNGIEWTDFEVKEAKNDLPKNIWETVSAFSNTNGGWIVLGIKERKGERGTSFDIQGIDRPEKIEQDFINVIRSNGKFNQRLSVQSERFEIDGKTIMAFYVPMSETKPIYITNPVNTFIRVGSGDQRATDFEVRAMQRDQAFGKKSNEVVFETSFADINQKSFQSFREYLRGFNPMLQYNALSDKEFAIKTGIVVNGLLTIGGLLMFGNLEVILRFNPDFMIDYMEIPGTTIQDASRRYTFRIQEQENIWEYYNVILQRLRNHVDNPYSPRPDGIAPEDNSQIYCIREALVNMLAHADYFSEIHSTVRVFDDHIQFQNAGRFPVDLEMVGRTLVSQPRNPNLLRFFKLARISENGGYGIDKILNWRNLTGCEVDIQSDITKSEVTFNLPRRGLNRQLPPAVNQGELQDAAQEREAAETILRLIKENDKISISELTDAIGLSKSSINRIISKLKDDGKLTRIGTARNGVWLLPPERNDSEMHSVVMEPETIYGAETLSQTILKMISRNRRITIVEIAKACGFSRSHIDKILGQLKAEGKLVREGSPRNGFWVVK
ncbi:MAG: winged helix-turn-helix transcriptional regulator [Bacteroidales bacterium]|nr:winged helix-turn-helix transcriptional regulator [Bacteroidales bacterium]